MQMLFALSPKRWPLCFCLGVLLALSSVVLGCGKPKPVAQPGDEKEAIAVTTTCLEAWKQGTIADLPMKTPPIRFTDDDLLEGLTLEGFQVSDKTLPEAGRQRVEAQLKLRDLRGNAIQRNAKYQVTLRPLPLVF